MRSAISAIEAARLSGCSASAPQAVDAGALLARALLDTSPDCIKLLDSAGRLLFMGESGLAAMEVHDFEAIRGRLWWELWPSESRGAVERAVAAAAAGRPARFNGFCPTAGGTPRWWDVVVSPVSGGTIDGSTYLIAISRDITASKAAYETLHEQERRLAVVFGQAMVGMMHRDLDGRVLMVNQRYCDIVGRSREELEHLPMTRFTHPDDLLWNVPLFEKACLTGEPFQIEKRYVRPDGSHIWCDVSVSFVRDNAGSITSTIVIAQDIQERRLAEEQASANQSLLQTVIDSVEDLIFVKDRDGRFVLCNRRLNEGCGPLVGERVHDHFVAELADGYAQEDRIVLEQGGISRVEEIIPISGENRSFQTVKVPWRDKGAIVGVIGVSRDITERQKAEAELRESQRQLTTLISNLPGIAYRSTAEPPWRMTFISGGVEAIAGYPASDFTGGRLAWADLIHPDDLSGVERGVTDALGRGEPFMLTYRIIARDGAVRWVGEHGQAVVESGEVSHLEGFIGDITEHRTATERVRWAAEHDELTGLPNRRLFRQRLREVLEGAGRSRAALLLLDVDNLKSVNDMLGHDAGDRLLCAVAERLVAALPADATVARQGGDEFAVLLPGIEDVAAAAATAERLLDMLRQPLSFGRARLDCRSSVGMAVYPDHGDDGALLLQNADIALYAAKAAGRSRVVMFEPQLRSAAETRTTMIMTARAALDEARVHPHYQPQVDLRTGRLIGFEMLLRWDHPEHGLQSPAAIAAAFEDGDIALALRDCMQQRMLADMRCWQEAGVPFGRIAINASAAEFRSDDFAERLLERCAAAGISPSLVELEVTETVFLGQGAEHVARALRALSDAGMRIALDDFGTGYASLSHLQAYPVDVIKIDRSFVRDVVASESDAAILRAIVGLGANLGMETVAEGIETAAQARFVCAQGCDIGQGYLFGRAIPAAELPVLVRGWNAPARRNCPSLRLG